MRFSVYQVSRKGGREKNEDRMGYCYTRDAGLFALADGMGGHPEGEVASQLALQTLAALFQRDCKPTLQDFIITARELKKQKVFRESTIRSLFDEILRGLRIVHQHKMLHLDIKPANIFITDDNRAVMIDFGAAREVLSKEGNFIRPMYTPGFAAPEMYRRDGTLGPWTDIYAIGACIYACMQGYPPNDAPQRIEKDRLALSLSRLRNVYSDNLIEVTEWCMSLDPLSRPQSVFALQKELSRETERQYTKLSFSERLKLQLENLTASAKA